MIYKFQGESQLSFLWQRQKKESLQRNMFARETLKFSQTIVAYEGAIVWNWKDLN